MLLSSSHWVPLSLAFTAVIWKWEIWPLSFHCIKLCHSDRRVNCPPASSKCSGGVCHSSLAHAHSVSSFVRPDKRWTNGLCPDMRAWVTSQWLSRQWESWLKWRLCRGLSRVTRSGSALLMRVSWGGRHEGVMRRVNCQLSPWAAPYLNPSCIQKICCFLCGFLHFLKGYFQSTPPPRELSWSFRLPRQSDCQNRRHLRAASSSLFPRSGRNCLHS